MGGCQIPHSCYLGCANQHEPLKSYLFQLPPHANSKIEQPHRDFFNFMIGWKRVKLKKPSWRRKIIAPYECGLFLNSIRFCQLHCRDLPEGKGCLNLYTGKEYTSIHQNEELTGFKHLGCGFVWPFAIGNEDGYESLKRARYDVNDLTVAGATGGHPVAPAIHSFGRAGIGKHLC